MLEKTPESPEEELPLWAQNEMLIIYVKIALGGDFAGDAFVDYLYRCRPTDTTISVDEIALVLAECLKLEKVLDLKLIAVIVLNWIGRAASGRPIDHRAHALIEEWGRRQLNSGPGRRIDSAIKRLAVRWAFFELARTRPNARSVKKQMYHELETKFGLKRSQLSKLLSNFDPWRFTVSDELRLGARDSEVSDKLRQ